jgi:hypothetical protein
MSDYIHAENGNAFVGSSGAGSGVQLMKYNSFTSVTMYLPGKYNPFFTYV